MGRTLAELHATMGAGELEVWAAFAEEYGLPDAFFTTGQVCTTVARSIGSARDIGPEDFVPYLKQYVPQPAAEGLARFKALMLARSARARTEDT